MGRYKVVTFRGFCFASTYQLAKQAAFNMVQGIAGDGFPESFWWSQIIDTNRLLSQLVVRTGSYRWTKTRWLNL